MDIFWILLVSLWFYPILAKLSLYLTKGSLKARKYFIAIPLSIATIVLLSFLTGISTTSEDLDFFLISIIYLSVSQLLFLAYTFKNVVIKIISGFAMACVFFLGYTLSTIGFLGLGMIAMPLQTTRAVRLSDKLVFKQHNLGNAISDYRGIEITLFKNYAWLPGIERQIFEKSYNEDILFKGEKVPANTKKPTLYSNNFNISYIAAKQLVILSDSVKKDTIRLK
jgi:hypothetical protein